MLWKKLKTQKGKEQPIVTSNENPNDRIKQYKKMDLNQQLQFTDKLLETDRNHPEENKQVQDIKNYTDNGQQDPSFENQNARRSQILQNNTPNFNKLQKTKTFKQYQLDEHKQQNALIPAEQLKLENLNQQIKQNNQQNKKVSQEVDTKLSNIEKQKATETYFSTIPNRSNSQLYKQFKSYSQGISKNQRENIKSGIKWSGEDPVIMYSEPSSQSDALNTMHFGPSIKNIENRKASNQDMGVDEFFKKIQQAGVDISDLQSNAHRSRIDSYRSPNQQAEELGLFINVKASVSQIQHVGSVNAKSEFALSYHRIQFDKFKTSSAQNDQNEEIMRRESSKNQDQSRMYQLTLSNRKQISFKQQKIIRAIDIRSPKKQNLIKKLKGVIDQITMLKLELQMMKSDDSSFTEIHQKIQQCSQQFQQRITQFQLSAKKNLNKSKNQTEIIEQLRHRIESLETQILQKQTKIRKLNESITQYANRCEEIGEALFDANQKIAQSELIFASRLETLVQKYEEKEAGKEIKNQEFSDLQIRRLSQEVEQLTKLYEQSQLQQKNSLESEKMFLSIEQQKLARKQVALHQKQLRLNKIEEQLNQKQMLLNKQELEQSKKRDEINNLQKVLMDKFQKMQQLEVQLNEGFVYIQQVKKDHYENMLALEQDKTQLENKVVLLQRKVQALEKQLKAKKQVDFSVYEMKNNSKNVIAEQDKSNSPKFSENKNKNRTAENDINYQDFYFEQNQQLFDRDDYQFSFNKPNIHTDRNKYQKNNQNARMIVANNERSQKFISYERPCRTQLEYPLTDFAKSQYRSQTGSNQGYFQKGKVYLDSDFNSRPFDSKLRRYKKDNRFLSQVLSTGKIEHNMSRIHDIREPKIRLFKSEKFDKNLRNLKSLGKKIPQNQKIGQLDIKIENLRKQIKKQISAARQN